MARRNASIEATVPAQVRVLVGMNWPNGAGGEHRAERGDLLPAADLGPSLKTALQDGLVEPVPVVDAVISPATAPAQEEE